MAGASSGPLYPARSPKRLRGMSESASERSGAVSGRPRYGTPEARALHARFPAIDFHADSLMWARWVDYDLHRRHDPPLPRAALGGHVDVPRLLEGGFGAQFFGL